MSIQSAQSVRIALRGIGSNKLRSGLTVLGILIGVASVIALVAVGTGSSASVQRQIDNLGTDSLQVINTGRFRAAGGRPGGGGTQARAVTLAEADVAALRNKDDAPDVAAISPVITTTGDASAGAATYTIPQLVGTDVEYLDTNNRKVKTGAAFSNDNVTNRDKVILVGTTVATNLFGTDDAVGQALKIGTSSFTVVGVFDPRGTNGNQDQDAIAVAPYTAVQDTVSGAKTFTNLSVRATSSKTVNQAQAEVQTILDSRHPATGASTTSPFQVLNQSSLLTTSASTNRTFTILLAAVAAISLLVGGIGVMNIMLVTVTERTREIGIRKAIGAPRSAILSQFLVEAVLLSLLGGAAGVAVGLAVSQLKIAGVQPVVDPRSIVLAFAVAIAVGVFFGFYPANRAAALKPIDALRYE